MNQDKAPTNRDGSSSSRTGVEGYDEFAHVRYQVADIDRSIDFYTQQLGFELRQRVGKAFGSVALGRLRLILSGPGSSGARPMPDGRKQEPGGWNRILIYVKHLDAHIERLKSQGVRFRNAVEAGPGGKQIQIEDPDGNPIELHEAVEAGRSKVHAREPVV